MSVERPIRGTEHCRCIYWSYTFTYIAYWVVSRNLKCGVQSAGDTIQRHDTSCISVGMPSDTKQQAGW